MFDLTQPSDLGFQKLNSKNDTLFRIGLYFFRFVRYSKDSIADLALCKTGKRDMICDQVEEWLEDQSNDDNESLVHGNLRRENMLFHDGRVGLVDFETCGAGSRYDDLSSLCSNLALTRAAAIFSWRLVFSACSSFLRGYREIFSFDRQALRKKTLMQLSTNYFWILAGKSVTIAKIPISKRRLAKTIQLSLDDDWEKAFPGIDF